MLKNIYINGSVRTPHGSFMGALSELTAPKLGSIAIREALKRAGADPREVDAVYFGNVIGAGLGQNVARQAALGAGLGVNVPAATISKVCGSGMQAAISAAQAIQCGDARLMVAGGCESMTNAPYLLPRARSGYRMGNGELIDAMIHDGLWDVYTNQHMGNCGDLCASKYNFSRKEQDDYALSSFQRAIKAWESGFFKAETTPVEIKGKKGTVVVDKDEDVAKFQGEEKLRALRAAFGPESTITAGNASSISDGASAMIVFDDDKKKALGLKPQARILGYAGAAMEPDWFTIAPIQAIRRLCDKLQIKPGDVDLFEINEAFAVVPMVTMKELGLDHAKVNIAGGAVAIGHPIGATGARIITTLVNGLHHHNKRLGIAALCIGGGEALAIAIERVE
jgi:acetyl-CoA C-acetyltransferase